MTDLGEDGYRDGETPRDDLRSASSSQRNGCVETPIYFLTSERLGFRRWREDDLDLAVGLWADPAVTRWIDARDRLDRDAVRDRLREEMVLERDHGVQYWPMFRLAGSVDADRHVGCCGLHPCRDRPGVLELGVHVRAACWRRGYAREAARAVIDHAFDHLDIETLFAGHNPANVASRNLLSALGFRPVADEYYPPTGLMHPSYLLRRRDLPASDSE